MATPIASAAEIAEIVTPLLSPIFPAPKGIRLLGVMLSSLDATDAEHGPHLALAL